MNILFLNSIEVGTFGGMEEWIRLTAHGLAGKGHEVTAAGRDGSEFLRRIEETTDKVTILPLKISGDFNPATIKQIKKYLDKNKIDIIVVNFNKDVRLGGLAARFNETTRVIWSVGLDITKDSFVHKFLTPKLIDGVIVPSEALKRQITRLGYIEEEIVEVIPIGIPPVDNAPSRQYARRRLRDRYDIDDRCIIAVTSGRFVNQKGHKYLIEAAPMILREFPEVQFLLLGDGPLREQMIRQMNELRVHDHFIFAGMLDDLDIELHGADLMIHPSIEEPFGIAVLEGMRAGLPIAASRVGGIPEVVAEHENAVLTEPANPERLAEGVAKILESRGIAEKFGQHGRERWRALFRLETMINNIENYLMKFSMLA